MILGAARQKLLALRRSQSLDAHVDYWGLFGGSELLIAGWVHDAGASLELLEIRADQADLSLTALTVVRGGRPDVSAMYGGDPSDRFGFVIKATLSHGASAESTLSLRVKSGPRETELHLEGGERNRGDQFIRSIRSYSDRDRQAASRLGVGVLGAGAIDLDAVRMNVEQAMVVGKVGVFFRGWLLDPERSVAGLRLRVGSHTTDDLLPTLGRVPRPDVERTFGAELVAGSECGLVCFARIPVPEGAVTCELLLTTRGVVISVPANFSPLPREPVRLTEQLLEGLDPFRPGAIELLGLHLGPAIEAAWVPPAIEPREVRRSTFGTLPSTPARSVVVPLFGRADFMLYQLNEFARDPDFRDTEVIYVVDDPRLVDPARALARSLHELLGVPLQVIDSGKNRGFAGANNLGVRHASGRYVVLLNSDVLPARAGWLSRLEHELQALPDAGPIAPRLLFHDGTIQHDGIAFYRDPTWPTLWLNDHPGKGLPAFLANGPRVERVPAVSAACLMIERELYERLGGLDEHYIVGDYEDSDLCLKAAASGRGSYVARDETLFHLERQSQSLAGTGSWRLRLTLYNAWRHGRRWANEIEGLADARRAT